MKRALLLAACLVLPWTAAHAASKPAVAAPKAETTTPDDGAIFTPESVSSDGSVTIEGRRVDYRAVAGTLVVHPKGWDDAARSQGRRQGFGRRQR